jgi:pyruvate/2-oxoglutarate dehydrogenase complex dihydrolipoamide acyltransferase (E2) component
VEVGEEAADFGGVEEDVGEAHASAAEAAAEDVEAERARRVEVADASGKPLDGAEPARGSRPIVDAPDREVGRDGTREAKPLAHSVGLLHGERATDVEMLHPGHDALSDARVVVGALADRTVRRDAGGDRVRRRLRGRRGSVRGGGSPAAYEQGQRRHESRGEVARMRRRIGGRRHVVSTRGPVVSLAAIGRWRRCVSIQPGAGGHPASQ